MLTRRCLSTGVSLLTQLLYLVVFVTRYTDLFSESFAWNYFFKVFYLLSSFYTIAIMRFVYPRTREREIAWKLAALVLGVTILLSPFVMLAFSDDRSFSEYLWTVSQVLESVAVLPQLLLLRQTTIPTVITSFYIVFLGSYRGLYLINWIQREFDTNMKKPNPTSVLFGIIQTALYIDFAWVYWSRQRVKLRNGGVVDADDLSRGWLLRRIFGNKRFGGRGGADGGLDDGDDEESAPALGRGGFNHHQQSSSSRGLGVGGNNGGSNNTRPKWGSRGISISADEGVFEAERARGDAFDDGDDDEEHGVTDVDPDARMRDPDELARVLDEEEEEEEDDDDEDDEDDDDDDDDSSEGSSSSGSSSAQKKKKAGTHADAKGQPSGVGNGDEWNDD